MISRVRNGEGKITARAKCGLREGTADRSGTEWDKVEHGGTRQRYQNGTGYQSGLLDEGKLR